MSVQTRQQPDEDLILHLERDQTVAETSKPVAPAQLSSRVVAGLWALRICIRS